MREGKWERREGKSGRNREDEKEGKRVRGEKG